MDYQQEYILKNPGLGLDESDKKAIQILSFLGSNNFKSMIDIACGAGRITTILKQKLRLKKVVGVDISKTMIRNAKSKNITEEVEWICCDIFKYKTKYVFDLVLAIDILEHVVDDLALIKKISRMGKMTLIKTPMEDSFLDNKIMRRLGIRDHWKESEERYGHVHHYNERQLADLVEKADCEIVKEDYIPLPKRSTVFWEVFRIIFLPIGWFSKKAMTNFVGGFKIVLIKKKDEN
jgi:trans-aconitate methyltransferase